MNKLRVTAIKIGEGAHGAFLRKAAEARGAAGFTLPGRIHSCFERVFNIVLPGRSDGTDLVIGLCRPDVPLSPLHLSIAWRSAFSDLPVREGEPVLVTHRELIFPSLVVAWGEAEEYATFFQRQEHAGSQASPLPDSAYPAIRELCARMVAKGLAADPRFWEGLLPLIQHFDCDSGNWTSPDAQAGDEYGLPDGGNPAVAKCALSRTTARAAPVLCRLSAGMRERRRDLVFGAARDMLGLGPGLTPSGDDFLTGLILADLTWNRRFPSRPVLGGQAMWLRLAGEASSLTGAISCQQIRLAAGGAGNEVFERVCWRLFRVDEQVLSDIPVLARFGATSGLDYLAGLVFALRHLLMLSA